MADNSDQYNKSIEDTDTSEDNLTSDNNSNKFAIKFYFSQMVYFKSNFFYLKTI
jgi:hypothetical protein